MSLVSGLGRSPNGNTFLYSCLDNCMDRGAWQITLHEVAKNQKWLSNWEHPPPTHTRTHTLCAYANPNHPVSHFPPCFPFVTISLISRSANLFLFFYLRSFVSFLIDSVSKRYQMIFIFLCLTSLSMIISRSSHVSTNSIVSFFSYG